MSVVDWLCKKISLESASGQLSAITISRQQVLPSKLDACANVTTCCCILQFPNLAEFREKVSYFFGGGRGGGGTFSFRILRCICQLTSRKKTTVLARCSRFLASGLVTLHRPAPLIGDNTWMEKIVKTTARSRSSTHLIYLVVCIQSSSLNCTILQVRRRRKS